MFQLLVRAALWLARWLVVQSRMTQRLKWSHIHSALSPYPSGTCFFPRSDTALHNNVKKKKKKAHAHVCMQTRKPCNNEGKKKPTINSTITAAITPSVEPPLFTSHLITDESRLGCSQKFMNWALTSSYTCLSGHKHQRRNKCFSASYMLLFFLPRNLWHPCVKAHNLFTRRPLPFLSFLPPLVSSPSSPPPSHGLRELLAIWMLALYCEHSLIASAAPHSQSGQSAWGPGCLPYLPLLSRHTLRKKQRRNGESDGESERERERKGEGGHL